MNPESASPTSLLGLISSIPADQTAVILPEQNIRITYGESAGSRSRRSPKRLAAAGIGRGDRVGIALAERPADDRVVSRRVDGRHGGAAQSRVQGRRVLASTSRTRTPACCCCRPTAPTRRGAPPAIACRSSRSTWTQRGTVRLAGRDRPARRSTPPAVDDVALILHTSGSTGRPKRVPLSHANLSISAGNVARSYALTADDVSLCVMPLFHVHGLVASTLATLATGGTVVVPAQVQPAVVLARRPRSRRDLVFGRADAAPAAARARRSRLGQAGRRREAALHPIVQRVAAAAGDARSGGRVRRAGARGVRHDGGRASDGLQSAAARRAQARIGRTRHGRPHQHHGRGGPASADRRARRGRHPGPERHSRLREQSRGQRDVVRRRLVPDRRSGLPGRATAI